MLVWILIQLGISQWPTIFLACKSLQTLLLLCLFVRLYIFSVTIYCRKHQWVLHFCFVVGDVLTYIIFQCQWQGGGGYWNIKFTLQLYEGFWKIVNSFNFLHNWIINFYNIILWETTLIFFASFRPFHVEPRNIVDDPQERVSAEAAILNSRVHYYSRLTGSSDRLLVSQITIQLHVTANLNLDLYLQCCYFIKIATAFTGKKCISSERHSGAAWVWMI